MANKYRGEAAVTIDGREYTLRPSFDSLCELETLIDASIDAALKQVNEGRLSGLRAVVWALLHECHGKEIRTLKDASNWIEAASNAGVDVFEAVYRCFQLNIDASIQESAGTANPPSAQAGISTSSSSTPVESA